MSFSWSNSFQSIYIYMNIYSLYIIFRAVEIID